MGINGCWLSPATLTPPVTELQQLLLQHPVGGLRKAPAWAGGSGSSSMHPRGLAGPLLEEGAARSGLVWAPPGSPCSCHLPGGLEKPLIARRVT